MEVLEFESSGQLLSLGVASCNGDPTATVTETS
jgi:hypothetical protein